MATVSNDPANMGVDWYLSCAVASCGSLSATHTASGAPVMFTAPKSVPPGNNGAVNVNARATADQTKTVTATVLITLPPLSINFTQAPPSTLQIGAPVNLSVTVSNDAQNLGVDWTVSCTPAASTTDCGSFNPAHTPSGQATQYTPPASVPRSGSVTITATATAEPSQAVSATATIIAPPISVAIKQLPPPLQIGTSGALVATVTNDPSNKGVDWKVSCTPAPGTTDCGSFNPAHTASGAPTTYTAPAAVPLGNAVTISAISTADPTKSASAAVAITSAMAGVSISFVQSPPHTLLPGHPVTLSASVSNDPQNLGVDWSVTCTPAPGTTNCGSFNPTHTASAAPTVYTAPASPPGGSTVTIAAQATADKTKTATATIIIGAPISIALTEPQTPPQSLQTGQQLPLAATITNDPTNAGVDWTVTCASQDCGSFNPTHTQSGASTTYTAPASVPSGGTVTITGASTADPTQTTGLSNLPIVTAGLAALLQGQYAFLIAGTDSQGNTYSVAGSITADGHGTIQTGEEDFVDSNPDLDQTGVQITGGSYSVGSDGRGTMTLNLSNGTQTLNFTVVSSQHALAIEFDGNTSSGSLDLQDPTKFSASAVTGGYSFTFSGLDLTKTPLAPLALGGVLAADGNGNFGQVTEDVNDQGQVSSNSFSSWTYTAPDTSGRGTSTATTAAGATYTFAYYVVDSGRLRFVETDSNALTHGSLMAQGPSPALGAGNYAFTLTGTSSTGALVAGGLFTSDGKGNISSAVLDVNNAGQLLPGGTATGTYTPDSNNDGRGTLTLNAAVGGLQKLALYLTANQGVLLLELDSGLTSTGAAFSQAGAIGASTFSGDYAVNFQTAAQNGELDLVGQFFSDGASTLTGQADVNQFGSAPTAGTQLTGTFTANPSGRFTPGTLQTSVTGKLNEIFYVVNSSTVLFVEMDANGATTGPAAGTLQLQQGFSVPVEVFLTQPPPGSLQAGQQAQLTATLTNDSANKGVDWTVSCTPAASSDCGSFNPAHTSSGQPTTYTAPASVPQSGGAVTITATATAVPTQTATAVVAITSPSQGVSITLTQPPPQSINVGGSAPVTATVTNDPANKGVDWTVTCGNFDNQDCGGFDPPHTASGVPTTYYAPSDYPPAGSTVSIIATATADSTKTTTANVTINGTRPPISISFVLAPPASMQTNSQAQMSAQVNNDPAQLGVDWSVTCQSSDCGSFNPAHTQSSVTTTYTAPASVPTGGTVTITATATADPTKSVSQGVTITSPGNVGLLNGQYAFFITGTNAQPVHYAVAGSLTTDGSGNIQSGGQEDLVDAQNGHLQHQITGGTYQIGSDGRGTMTLNLEDGTQQMLSFAVVSKQRALIIQFDYQATSSGSLDLQDLSQPISGPYSFIFAGVDASTFQTLPLEIGGVVTASGHGGFNSGTVDVNDNGIVTKSTSVTGSYSTPLDQWGHGTATMGPYNFAYYMVNSSTIRFIETDCCNNPPYFVTIGSAFAQGTNPSFGGNYAFTLAGTPGSSAPGLVVAGGLLTSDGKGGITATLDVNNNGTVTGNTAASGSYQLDANNDGRGVLTLTNATDGLQKFAFYLSGQGILLLELDSDAVSSGTALPQASPPLTFSGSYALNFQALSTPHGNGEEDVDAQVTSDGTSELTGTADINQIGINNGNGGITQPLTGTFASSPNGRFTGTLNTSYTGTLNEVFYVVNSSTVLLLNADPSNPDNPATGILQLQNFQ